MEGYLEKATDISDSKYVITGGIGVIVEKNMFIYKICYFEMAFNNNVNGFLALKDKITISSPAGKRSGVARLEKYYRKKVTEGALSKHLLDLYQKNRQAIEREKNGLCLYVLKYEKFDTNSFFLFSNFTLDQRDEVISFFIIWIFVVANYLNTDLKLHHNDLKMDNVLVRKKLTKHVSVYFVGKIVLYNRTDFDFFLNDFDLMIGKNVHDDIAKIKASLSKVFGTCKSKLVQNILSKVEQINCAKDIYTKWLNKSSLFRYMITSDILNRFIDS